MDKFTIKATTPDSSTIITAESVQGPNIPPSPKTGSKKGMMNNNIAEDIGAW